MAEEEARSRTSKKHSFIFLVVVTLLNLTDCTANDQVWQQDLTSDISIGASTSGYRSLTLHCAEDHVSVQLELDEPFEGAFYTRGTFYERRAPCFVQGDGSEKVKLRIPLDDCATQKENKVYSNVVVLQHDAELIMPGDTAFRIECDHSRSLENALESNELDHGISSKISLVDADPAAKVPAQELQISVMSDSETVEFRPDSLSQKSSKVKDEL